MPEQNTPTPILVADIRKGDLIRKEYAPLGAFSAATACEYVAEADGQDHVALFDGNLFLLNRPVALSVEPSRLRIAAKDGDK